MKKLLWMIALLGLVIGQVSAQMSDMRHIDSLLSRSRHTEALRFAMSILSERPDDMVLRHKVGDILAEVGDARGATREYEQVLIDFEPKEVIERKLALQQYRLGKYYDALGYLRSIFARGDTTFVDCDLAGRIFNQIFEPDSAIIYQREAVRLVPGSANNVIRLATNFQALELPDSVLLYTSAYLNHDSTNITVRGIRGLQYYNINKIDSAYLDFKVLYEQGDLSPNTLYYYGLCLKEKRQFREAAKVFLLGDTVTQGKNAWILLELGHLAKQKIIHPTPATEYYRRAEAAIKPDSALFMRVQQELAFSLFTENKLSESVKHWELVLENAPKHPQATYAMGMIYGKMKNSKQEKRYYERFLKLVANDPRISKEYDGLIEAVKERLQTLKEKEFMERK